MKLTKQDINNYGTPKEKISLKEVRKNFYKDDKEQFDIKLEITGYIDKYDKKGEPIEYSISKGYEHYKIKAEVKEIWDEDDEDVSEENKTVIYKWAWYNDNEPDHWSKGYWNDAETAITNLFYET